MVEARKIKNKLYDELHKRQKLNDPPQKGWDDLPEDIMQSAIKISHFFDYAGALVMHKLVKKEPIIGWIGGSVTEYWMLLSPFILRERENHFKYYQAYFEMLNNTALKYNQADIIKSLMNEKT